MSGGRDMKTAVDTNIFQVKLYPDCTRGTACGTIEGARRSGCTPFTPSPARIIFVKSHTGPPGAGTFAGLPVSNR